MKKIELVNLKQPAGGLSKWLEVRVVLKWSREAVNSTSGQSSTPTDSLSSRAQSIAASALGMLPLRTCSFSTAWACISCVCVFVTKAWLHCSDDYRHADRG